MFHLLAQKGHVRFLFHLTILFLNLACIIATLYHEKIFCALHQIYHFVNDAI